MKYSKLAPWLAAGALMLMGLVGQAHAADAPKFDNSLCLGCHGNQGFAMPGPNGKMRQLYIDKNRFEHSVHGKRHCVDCHTDIVKIPHRAGVERKVSCVNCHEQLWDNAEIEGKTKQYAELGVVVKQIKSYMRSIHAQPSRADQSRTNATCYNCHNPHYVYPKGTPQRLAWRLDIPNICGKCHRGELAQYRKSVHGQEVLVKHNPKAAVCADCHTTHGIRNPWLDKTQLVITKNCGHCHAEQLKTYLETYHGQVNTLGYAYTAKCFDCHGHHDILRVSDPKSTVSPQNRLATCRQCHVGATKGFITFSPHGNAHDFKDYPQMWLTSKFMATLLIGVFAFFWLHSGLWYYREYQDRKARKNKPRVMTEDLDLAPGKQFRRFGPIWRIGHLLFAVSVMMLVLTGMALFYGDTAWAKFIMGLFGSPRISGIVHRTSAAIMLGIFFIHLVYMCIHIGRNWRTFDWLGPNSLVPRWRDLQDIAAMFKWFVGKGPRPLFDRWTYWEKFDYWAVFWGMAVIGGSGLMLAFPNVTASVLPGWIFNVATIIHGEEAFLAAVFLFTVHFFNNHLRPDKLPPPDIVMFTGSVALEEFRHEHALEYQRLVESGELEKHLVDAPSHPMTLGSRILGIALLLFGLFLLILVVVGFASNV